MSSSDRSGFSSRIGGLLAAAGSAVGLGNIWRFPTECGENGGAAFLLVYFIIILSFGIPALIVEFVIGRRSKANVGNAYGKLAPGSLWKWVGVGSVFVAFVIMCYYNVVVGWVLEYAYESVTFGFNSMGAEAAKNPDVFGKFFGEFVSDPWRPIATLIIVLAIMHTVIVLGVEKGIERVSKLLVPALFVVMLMLVCFAATMPGAAEGYKFLFFPDFSKISDGEVWLSALGQCFYSFSLGMGLVTYASYFKNDVNLPKTAFSVAGLDTAVALLAGLIIFPAVFSVPGLKPSEGAGLTFISLPYVFNSTLSDVPFALWAVTSAFYLILLVAALTSCIFLHEVATAYVSEHLNWRRAKAAALVTGVSFVIGCAASLSMGPWSDPVFFGMNFFDFLDYATVKVVLPITGLGTVLFFGYKLTGTHRADEITSGGRYQFKILGIPLMGAFMFAVKAIIPLLIVTIMVAQFMK